ncbi:MAG: hypothetical protein HDT42_09195 [Ruminococcaceae bacterium]|nr:hypothetical protein [Oscillospiraceae bacterium]
MLRHGINTYKDTEDVFTVQSAAVGIPFYIGAWPCHMGRGYAGKPQYVKKYGEAKDLGGYSDEWRNADGSPKWSLCQAVYAHFALMGVSPAIFYNLYNPEEHKKAVPADVFEVADYVVRLPADAIVNDNLVVKADDTTLVKGVDYETYYQNGALYIELLDSSVSYDATVLTIGYDIADLSGITAEDVELAVEEIEKCRSVCRVVPDLICAPGWSKNPIVAAVMAAKAPSINTVFRAKAVVDLDTTVATDFTKVLSAKNDNGYTSEDMIVCWPMVKKGDMLFDLSVIICALIAKVDSGNGNCPYESPSNKEIPISGAVLADGTEVNLSLPDADTVSVADGVVTAINFYGWVLWGNYLGCYPKNDHVERKFICTNRVQDWICNTFVATYWRFVDRPITTALRDAITLSFNTWLNGLTAEHKLYGGKIEYITELNPVTNLQDGIFRLDTTAASPVPAQQIDMHVTYSLDMLEAAMSS